MSSVSSTGIATSDYSMLSIGGGGTTSGVSDLQRRTMRTLENWQRRGVRDFVDRMGALKDGVADLRQVIEDSDLLGTRSGTVRFGSEKDIGLAAGESSTKLADLATFSSVVAGSFEVNGVSISVDPSSDSLDDIIDRIKASGAGATAIYSDVDRVTIKAHGSLELAGDTSGLLDALHLREGLQRNHGGTEQQIRDGARTITQAIENLQAPINDIYSEVQYESTSRSVLVTARSAIQTALALAFGGEDATSFETNWGFRLDVDQEDITVGTSVIDLSTADLKSIRQTLTDSPTDVLEFLVGNGVDDDGFLTAIEDGITRALDNLGEELGYTGSMLDVLV